MTFKDSEATHNFFNDKNWFEVLQEITPQTVKIAEGVAMIYSKDTVKTNPGNTINLEAYIALGFSANIIPSHIFTETFEVVMSATL